MHEEVSIYVPTNQVLRWYWLPFAFYRTQVDDERVTSLSRMLSKAILSTAKFTNGSPSFRCKVGSIKGPVRWHVDLGFRPGALIIRRHAKSCPYILSFLGGLLLREAVGKVYIPMCEEVLFLSFRE